MRRQSGFTLIEILVVLAITATLLTLGAAAVRHYWFVNALEGAADEVESELRTLQQRTIAESHPLVYGAWFKTDEQTNQWGILKYDPKDTSTSADDECSQIGASRTIGSGVVITAAAFDPAEGDINTTCSTAVPAGAEPVFFYARGSATAGELTLFHAETGGSRTVTVSGITGRVELQ